MVLAISLILVYFHAKNRCSRLVNSGNIPYIFLVNYRYFRLNIPFLYGFAKNPVLGIEGRDFTDHDVFLKQGKYS